MKISETVSDKVIEKEISNAAKRNIALVELIKRNIDTRQNYENLYILNKGFIYQTIKKYVNDEYTIEDLMQQAFFGLIAAVEKYDKNWSNNFLGILKYCIMNSIRDYKCQNEFPYHMLRKIIKYKNAYEKLYDFFGRKPTNSEMMMFLEVDTKEFDLIRRAIYKPISLNLQIGEDEETTRLDLLKDDNSIDVQDILEKEDLKKIVYEAVNKLPDDSKDIIHKRYFENKTLKSIGNEKNVSITRIKDTERKALNRLSKDHKFKEKICDFTEINEYKTVGIDEFNRTWTSSTEWLALGMYN